MKTKKSTTATRPAKPFSGYELGKTYLCHYWQQEHTIIALHEPTNKRGWMVTSKWADGHTTTHCTSLDKRDREVTE